MKAMVLREHGGGEKMKLETDFPNPVAGEGDVVIRVKASSLNYHDVFTRRGMPGINLPFPVIMGLDVAGEIIEVGPGVEGWAVGDRVLADPSNKVEGGLIGETVHGGLAERCRVRAHQLIRIPDGVPFEQAAALPVAYGTAHRMMQSIGQIKAGEKVLILGASGGVGVCCVQLAKLAGAEVIACAGTEEKGARLKELGADHIILYTQTDFMKAVHELTGKPGRNRTKVSGGVDVVVNFTGGDTWVKSLRCLRLGGRLLTCGATAGFDPKEDLRYVWSFELQIRGSNGWDRSDLVALLDLVNSGKLKAPIDRIWPLEDAAAALDTIEQRKVFGKIVVAS
ncbi:quinone oxidoreductase family protein [Lacisediminimonas profundi]|uniref:quinone oxidoreductase family protein n=1 Tax=Lacisediminimonas profundi TaxID=2603856 RepID=UPI00124BC1B6|nr:zinc-binding dehydrogenase [Lacisediminimonas profundi]